MFGVAEKAKLCVGYKQALRALKESKAEKVFLAEDCASHIKNGIEKLTIDSDTPVFYVPTMKELGNMCQIDVGSSCAVILK